MPQAVTYHLAGASLSLQATAGGTAYSYGRRSFGEARLGVRQPFVRIALADESSARSSRTTTRSARFLAARSARTWSAPSSRAPLEPVHDCSTRTMAAVPEFRATQFVQTVALRIHRRSTDRGSRSIPASPMAVNDAQADPEWSLIGTEQSAIATGGPPPRPLLETEQRESGAGSATTPRKERVGERHGRGFASDDAREHRQPVRGRNCAAATLCQVTSLASASRCWAPAGRAASPRPRSRRAAELLTEAQQRGSPSACRAGTLLSTATERHEEHAKPMPPRTSTNPNVQKVESVVTIWAFIRLAIATMMSRPRV